jgi:hypothetical protein
LPCAADLRTAFGLLDRNRDGRVTASELQFMLQNLGIQVRDELIHDLINEASHSGKDSQQPWMGDQLHLLQDNTVMSGTEHNVTLAAGHWANLEHAPCIETSGQLHALVALPPQKETLVLIERKLRVLLHGIIKNWEV